MNIILIISNVILVLLLVFFTILNTKRYKKLSQEMESMSLENDKIKFMLYVIEKKTKLYNQRVTKEVV